MSHTLGVSNFSPDLLSSVPDITKSQPRCYRYSPLLKRRSVRLLNIQSGDGDIVCSLKAVDLEESPSYDALSYTWGDPRPPLLQNIAPTQFQRRFDVICDGQKLSVTQNLQHALIKLRSNKEENGGQRTSSLQDLIWIDAICINQNDLEERGAQVEMMDEIYGRAQKVIGWLGRSDRYTEPAVNLINYLSTIPEADYPRYATLKLDEYQRTESEWEALVAFFHRSWFKRAWIVQEVVLATQLVVFCGDFEISWDVLLKCSNFMRGTFVFRHLTILASQFSSLEQRAEERTLTRIGLAVSQLAGIKGDLRQHTLPTWHILGLGRMFGATNPRDHVYALLGLLKGRKWSSSQDIIHPLLVPDYAKSPEGVFVDFAKFLVDETQNLLLLSMVEDRSERAIRFNESLPSWAPDLTVPILPGPLLPISILPTTKWDPSNEGQGVNVSPIIIDDRILCVNGAHFDTITGVSGALTDLENYFNWVDILDFMKPLWHTQVSGTTFGDALWRTIIADVGLSDEHPADPSLKRAFAEMLAHRLVLLRVAHLDIFESKNYTEVRTKLVQGIEDQARNDITAFGEGPIDTNQAADEQLIKLQVAEETRSKKHTERKKQAPDLYNRTLSALMGLSSADSNVFMTAEQVLRALKVLSSPSEPEHAAIRSRIRSFQTAMKDKTAGRRLFRTAGNYLGMTSVSARVGDDIWILRGQNLPFCLRSSDPGQFSLVGEAYVHGIMHGEAEINGQLNFQDIELV